MTAGCRRSTSIERLGSIAGPRPSTPPGVGQHQMWAAQFITLREARTVAELRRPRHHGLRRAGGDGRQGRPVPTPTVWAIDGDGCFQMTNQELATCAINDIPIKVALINNGNLGMVRQWQTLFYSERYSNTDLPVTASASRLRQAGRGLWRAYGLRCESCGRGRLDVIEKAHARSTTRPVGDRLRRRARTRMVWPMVAAGTSNDDIMVGAQTWPLD